MLYQKTLKTGTMKLCILHYKELIPIQTSFDEVSHTYTTDDGRRLPSVSTIINTAAHYAHIPKERQQMIMDRGTVLHQNIDYFIATGDTGGDKVLEAFSEVYHHLCMRYGNYTAGETPLGAEIDGLAYAGKPDIVLERAVIDIKSSLGVERVYAMQVAAYSLLLKAHAIIQEPLPELIICYRTRNGWAYKVVTQGYGKVSPYDAFYAMLVQHYANTVLQTYHNAL